MTKRSILANSISRRNRPDGHDRNNRTCDVATHGPRADQYNNPVVVAAGFAGSVAAYEFQIAQFQAMHPEITVVFETTSDEGYAPQLAAAFSSGEVPDVVTHLPSFAAQTYTPTACLSRWMM